MTSCRDTHAANPCSKPNGLQTIHKKQPSASYVCLKRNHRNRQRTTKAGTRAATATPPATAAVTTATICRGFGAGSYFCSHVVFAAFGSARRTPLISQPVFALCFGANTSPIEWYLQHLEANISHVEWHLQLLSCLRLHVVSKMIHGHCQHQNL